LNTLKLVKSHEYMVQSISPFPQSIHRISNAPSLISTHIPADLFKYLLDIHTNLLLIGISTDITPDDMTKTLQLVSADSRKRTVQFWVYTTTIINWLESYGITKGILQSRVNEGGDTSGEV
ncbi:hypothetical protein PENTCL1PPCAC_21559, partial [Pristionchus entomophagus]